MLSILTNRENQEYTAAVDTAADKTIFVCKPITAGQMAAYRDSILSMQVKATDAKPEQSYKIHTAKMNLFRDIIVEVRGLTDGRGAKLIGFKSEWVEFLPLDVICDIVDQAVSRNTMTEDERGN